MLVFGSRGYNDRPCGDRTVGSFHGEDVAVLADGIGRGGFEDSAEILGLLPHLIAEFIAVHRFGESGIVFHVADEKNGAAGGHLLDYHGFQVGPCSILRCGHSGGSAADDHEIPFCCHKYSPISLKNFPGIAWWEKSSSPFSTTLHESNNIWIVKQSSRLLKTIMTLLIFLLPAAVWGQARENGEVPRLEPAGAVVELASLEEPMSVDALIRIAFIASGTTDEDIETYIARMEGLIEAAPGRRGDAEGDAEVLLQWMHEGTLTRYVESQTRLDVLLDKGTYNCVSSAVLYMILVRSRGIPVRGVLTSDHAFCRIITGDDPSDPEDGIDVETTTSYGFDPGTRHEAVNSFSGRTGFTYVPPGNYRQRRDIGEKELISLIYQNRLAALQRSGRWVETVGLARDRWELAGSEASRNDFLTSIGNYAAEMNRQKRNIEALHFLDDAAAVLGENHGLADSASALLGNAVTYALRAGDTGKALAILSDEDAASLVPEAFLDERRSDVAVRILEERGKNRSLRSRCNRH